MKVHAPPIAVGGTPLHGLASTSDLLSPPTHPPPPIDAETVLRLCSPHLDMLVQLRGRPVKQGQHVLAQGGPLSVADAEFIMGSHDTGECEDVVLQRSAGWLAGRESHNLVDGSGRLQELCDARHAPPDHVGECWGVEVLGAAIAIVSRDV